MGKSKNKRKNEKIPAKLMDKKQKKKGNGRPEENVQQIIPALRDLERHMDADQQVQAIKKLAVMAQEPKNHPELLKANFVPIMLKKMNETHFLIQTAAINAMQLFVSASDQVHVNMILPNVIQTIKNILPKLVTHVFPEKKKRYDQCDRMMEEALQEKNTQALKSIKTDYEAAQMDMAQCIYTIIEILQFIKTACTQTENAAADVATQDVMDALLSLLPLTPKDNFDLQQLQMNTAEALNVLSDEHEALVHHVANRHPSFLNDSAATLQQTQYPLAFRTLIASIMYNMRYTMNDRLTLVHDIAPILLNMLAIDPIQSFETVFRQHIVRERNREEGRGRLTWWNDMEAQKVAIEVLSNLLIELSSDEQPQGSFFNFSNQHHLLHHLDTLYAALSKPIPSDIENQNDHSIDIEQVMLSQTFISLITCFNNYFIGASTLEGCERFIQPLFDDLCTKIDVYAQSIVTMKQDSERYDQVVEFLTTASSTLFSMLRSSPTPKASLFVSTKHVELFARLFEKYHVPDVRRIALGLLGVSTVKNLDFLPNTTNLLSKALLEDDFMIVSEAIDIVCDLFGTPQHDAVFTRHQLLNTLHVVAANMSDPSFENYLSHAHPEERHHLLGVRQNLNGFIQYKTSALH